MKNKNFITLFVILVVIALGYKFLTMPDQRTDGERLGQAFDALQQGEGLDEAAKKLENRTPGEELGDAIKGATDGE